MDHNDKTDLEIYQDFVEDMTWDSTKSHGIYWTTIALTSEVGEFAQLVEKSIRKGQSLYDENGFCKQEAFNELGDIMWNVAKLANDLGVGLDEVIEFNMSKLNERRYKTDT